MKALSIKEPFASMIYNDNKTIETRTWKTNYRGPLLLCASKKPKSPLAGKAFAIVDLIDCRDMTEKDEVATKCPVYPNAKAWIFKNIKCLINPFPVKGKLGLFEVEKWQIKAF